MLLVINYSNICLGLRVDFDGFIHKNLSPGTEFVWSAFSKALFLSKVDNIALHFRLNGDSVETASVLRV